MSVRAKFRCLGINKRWDNCSIVDLAPVYEDGSDENKSFWEATPSGSAVVKTGPECPFEVGAYYYIDFQKVDGVKPHEVSGLQHVLGRYSRVASQLDVELSSRWDCVDGIKSSEIKMSIGNAAAWPWFEGHIDSVWDVAYTPAPGSGD